MSEAVRSPLSRLFKQVTTKANPADLPGETLYVGLEHIGSGTGSIVSAGRADGVTSLVSRFEPGDVLFGRLRPYLRKVALATEAGVCSPEILVLRPQPGVVPEFLHALCFSRPVIDWCVRASSGSRMPRTSPADLGAAEVLLPSEEEQRDIADLLTAIQEARVQSESVAQSASALLQGWLDGLWDRLADAPTTTLGAEATLASGPSWAAGQERQESEDDTTPVVKITNTRPDGVLDMSERLHVAGLPASVRLLSEGSLVMIRTNGNRSRIGNVYRATPETFGHAVSAFQIAITCPSPIDANFVLALLRAPAMQDRISAAASGTTGLGNVAVKWLRQVTLPWPEAGNRADVVSEVGEMQQVIDGNRSAAQLFATLYDAAAGDLFSGRLRLPRDYASAVAS